MAVKNTLNQTSIVLQHQDWCNFRISKIKERLVKCQLKMIGMVKKKLYRTILIPIASTYSSTSSVMMILWSWLNQLRCFKTELVRICTLSAIMWANLTQQSPLFALNVIVICLFHWGTYLSAHQGERHSSYILGIVLFYSINTCTIHAVAFSNQITYNEQCNIYMYSIYMYISKFTILLLFCFSFSEFSKLWMMTTIGR